MADGIQNAALAAAVIHQSCLYTFGLVVSAAQTLQVLEIHVA